MVNGTAYLFWRVLVTNTPFIYTGHLNTAQNTFQTKCPNRTTSNTPPTPQTQKRKLAVNFGELISFLSIVEV